LQLAMGRINLLRPYLLGLRGAMSKRVLGAVASPERHRPVRMFAFFHPSNQLLAPFGVQTFGGTHLSMTTKARTAQAMLFARGFSVAGDKGGASAKPLQFEQVSTADLEGDEVEMMRGLSVAGEDTAAQARAKIELLHRVACRKGIPQYVDPSTHYVVLTSVELAKGGECCGNMCRHCPFGHAAVRAP